MSETRIGIVGLGGLGSQVAQALALLGVRNFVLIDPDRLEESNSNRVVLVRPADYFAKSYKATAIARAIRRLTGREANITAIRKRVQDSSTWRKLSECDLIVGCVDSLSARQFLNSVSSALLIPYVDGGVGIRVEDGSIKSAGGQVQVIVPGFSACRSCLRQDVKGEQVEQLGPLEKEASVRRGYISGAEIHNPQVVFLNGVIANLATWEIVKLVTQCSAVNSYLYYNLIDGSVIQPTGAERREDCFACSRDGALAAGAQHVESIVAAWNSESSMPDRTRVASGQDSLHAERSIQ